MDNVDRSMVNAEREASRAYSGEWVERAETRRQSQRRDSQNRESLAREHTQDSVLSSSTESSADNEDRMARIATARSAIPSMIGGTRTRTHPIEMSRTATHALQHAATVGAGTKTQSRTSSIALPAFGGGKPYPPELPPYEDFVVEFDGPDDPLHPQNWTFTKKLIMGAILSYTSLTSSFTSSIFSASAGEIEQKWHVGEVVATFDTSFYVLGYAFGPLVWGPFSELKGRKMPILVAMFGFMLFCFASATAENLQTLIICRFFSGFFGSCPLAVVAATFADMFDNKQRGAAIVVFASTVFLGPMLGPFVGGYIQMSYLKWRWNLYIPGIMGALSFVLNLFGLQETYAPIILCTKAAELRRLTKNWGIHAKQEEIEVDLKELMTKNFTRPIRLLITEPIILAISIYMSFIYGLMYLFLTAYPLVFTGVHGFNQGEAGLPFFGMVAGIFIVAGYIIWDSRNYNKKLEANGGIPVPEWRLPVVMFGGVAFTIGLFWFGWTGYTKSIPWIVPALSGIFTGCGLLAIFIQCFNYLVDSYLMFAASAISANTFCRSLAGAGFPLFARQMFVNLGIQWAGTLLGCLSLIMIPIPVLFYIFGKKLRQKSKFAPTMQSKTKADDEESTASEGGEDWESNYPALQSTISRAYPVNRNSTFRKSRMPGSNRNSFMPWGNAAADDTIHEENNTTATNGTANGALPNGQDKDE